jgi:hypothetical protein
MRWRIARSSDARSEVNAWSGRPPAVPGVGSAEGVGAQAYTKHASSAIEQRRISANLLWVQGCAISGACTRARKRCPGVLYDAARALPPLAAPDNFDVSRHHVDEVPPMKRKWLPAVAAVLVCVIPVSCGSTGGATAPTGSGAGGDWAARALAGMSLRQKVAQLMMPRIGGEYLAVGSETHERLRYWVEDLEIGGVIVSIGPPLELAVKLNMLQAMADVPLLVSADMEHGPGQILNAGVILPYGIENGGATRFPPMMGLGAAGDERLAYELGRVTALEGRAAGVHVAFAPVVDGVYAAWWSSVTASSPAS